MTPSPLWHSETIPEVLETTSHAILCAVMTSAEPTRAQVRLTCRPRSTMKRRPKASMVSLSAILENFEGAFSQVFEKRRDKPEKVSDLLKRTEREDCNSLEPFLGSLRILSDHKTTAGDLCSVVCSREGATSKTPKFVGLFARFPNTRKAGHRPACFRMPSAGIPRFVRNLGGAKEGRTPDLLNAIQTLYQLSYSPMARLTAVESSKSPPASQAEKRSWK